MIACVKIYRLIQNLTREDYQEQKYGQETKRKNFKGFLGIISVVTDGLPP